mmetsp:Transcript_24989/g.63378  ORF Transcript_24989/g.63378 Transcript_24989/m.63378 type:complete len:204 (-) Transcript_24989:397-1008(-)
MSSVRSCGNSGAVRRTNSSAAVRTSDAPAIHAWSIAAIAARALATPCMPPSSRSLRRCVICDLSITSSESGSVCVDMGPTADLRVSSAASSARIRSSSLPTSPSSASLASASASRSALSACSVLRAASFRSAARRACPESCADCTADVASSSATVSRVIALCLESNSPVSAPSAAARRSRSWPSTTAVESESTSATDAGRRAY